MKVILEKRSFLRSEFNIYVFIIISEFFKNLYWLNNDTYDIHYYFFN